MAIEAIQGISAVDAIAKIQRLNSTVQANEKVTGAGFGDILKQALEAAGSAEEADKAGSMALLTGDVNDLHTVTLETSQADLTLQLVVQLRNKALEAYNEIIKMSV